MLSIFKLTSTYSKYDVAGVVSKLNSATGIPCCATYGANIAAG